MSVRPRTCAARLGAAAGVTFALALLAAASPCVAHPVGVSRGEYRPLADGVEARLSFSRSELARLGDAASTVARIQVRSPKPCSAERVRRTEAEPDGVEFVARFRCGTKGPFRVSLAALFADLTRGHRHEARVRPDEAISLLSEAEPELVVGPLGPLDSTPRDGATRTFVGFVRLGTEHILRGYDHLVFLLGLVVIGLGTRRTIIVASAFTLAHSLSLAVAVLGLWTPPSTWVEPLIALSIVYVGLENLAAPSHERRAVLAFAFGLVHGFGFAGALSEARFQGRELVRALLGFNGGVELGQLAVLMVCLPLVNAARRSPLRGRFLMRVVSAGVALLGVAWLVTRLEGRG